MAAHLTTVDTALARTPGIASVWCGRSGTAAYQREPGYPHPAASMMKAAVLAALYGAIVAGRIDPDAPVLVHNEFASALTGAAPYGCDRHHDSDELVWQRLGSRVPVSWLARRMIVRSSNLATNLVLSQIGVPAVAEVIERAGARGCVVGRGIEDSAADDAGIANLVTAGGLAGLFGAMLDGRLPGSAAMVEIMCGQEFRDDIPAGLPAGTEVALKNGWIRGVRHSAGIVYPVDADPFVLAVCLTTPLAVNQHGDEACQLVARVAAAAWADRHQLG